MHNAYQDTLSDIKPFLNIHPKTVQELVDEDNRYLVNISIISTSDGEPDKKRKRLESNDDDLTDEPNNKRYRLRTKSST